KGNMCFDILTKILSNLGLFHKNLETGVHNPYMSIKNLKNDNLWRKSIVLKIKKCYNKKIGLRNLCNFR
ncbi:MAG: hypothetical protein IJ583_12145, partial [Firmicutes bacterium]|nr:hypothetical protein [Bacillota bacterium]